MATKTSNRGANHPERKDDEFFIGNDHDPSKLGEYWETARMGTIAYDVNGNIIRGAFPIFAKKQEIKEKNIGVFEKFEKELPKTDCIQK